MDSRRRQTLVVIFIISTILTGSGYSTLQKIQNESPGAHFNDKGKNVGFDHPYWQSMLASLGESFAFILYFLKKRFMKPDVQTRAPKLTNNLNDDTSSTFMVSEDEPPKPIRPILFAIPSWLDMTESVLKNLATTMIATSIVQMLRTTIFIYCALLALIFLKKRLYKHHWASMATIIVGVITVGLSYMFYRQQSKTYTASQQTVGLILLQVGQIIGAFAFVTEEKLLGDSEDLDPLLVVGFEGLWGLLAWAVLLPAFQFIHCDLASICTNGVVEDTVGVFEDYAANPTQIIYSVFMVFLVTFLNVSGVSVTKYGSSA